MVDFLNKNVEKIVIKGPKLCKKVKIYALNYNFTEFLLLNIVDQIFQNLQNFGKSGHQYLRLALLAAHTSLQ